MSASSAACVGEVVDLVAQTVTAAVELEPRRAQEQRVQLGDRCVAGRHPIRRSASSHVCETSLDGARGVRG